MIVTETAVAPVQVRLPLVNEKPATQPRQAPVVDEQVEQVDEQAEFDDAMKGEINDRSRQSLLQQDLTGMCCPYKLHSP